MRPGLPLLRAPQGFLSSEGESPGFFHLLTLPASSLALPCHTLLLVGHWIPHPISCLWATFHGVPRSRATAFIHLLPLTSLHSLISTHLPPLTRLHSPASTHQPPLTSLHSPSCIFHSSTCKIQFKGHLHYAAFLISPSGSDPSTCAPAAPPSLLHAPLLVFLDVCREVV